MERESTQSVDVRRTAKQMHSLAERPETRFLFPECPTVPTSGAHPWTNVDKTWLENTQPQKRNDQKN